MLFNQLTKFPKMHQNSCYLFYFSALYNIIIIQLQLKTI